jgi:DNA-binding transcriptional ArsR family regulator
VVQGQLPVFAALRLCRCAFVGPFYATVFDQRSRSAYFATGLYNQVAKHEMPNNRLDPLSTTFAALADPTRRAILARLADGEATVTQIAAPFDISLPGVSKHLRVLQRAGLIEQGRNAQWRPCRLDAEPLRDVAAWVGPYRRFWEESFDRLDDYLRELQAKESKRDDQDP